MAEVATHFVEVEPAAKRSTSPASAGAPTCSEPIVMTLAEYEAIRAESTHFGVVPHHEQTEIEIVIRRHPTYFVVEKREQDAQEVARDTDPRAEPSAALESLAEVLPQVQGGGTEGGSRLPHLPRPRSARGQRPRR